MTSDNTSAQEVDDLRTSLVGLSHLASGQMELEDVLTRVAEFAVSAIPGADGVGLTLLESGRADTMVASAPFVAEVDAIQYGIEEGPCITSAAEGRTVRSGELDTDPQWPSFGPQIGHLGVHSALSVPLLTHAGVLGSLNVYAHERDAFDENGARIGELFAEPAAIAVQNAHVLAQAQRLAAQLQVALGNQATIDQAIGVLMSRHGADPEQAMDQLSQASHEQHETLHTVALKIVNDAVRRAGGPDSDEP
ncbi:MAG: GAF and ANTAR domain-containing protein [Pseudonocardiales bacterium]